MGVLEENRQLRVQLQRSKLARQRVEEMASKLQRRLDHYEAVAAQQLKRKETEWMAEYDRTVQALLKIIRHHEQEKIQLETERQQLRADAAVGPPSINTMARSTQTEMPRATKVMSRRSSVRFAAEEMDTAGDIDAKVKINLVRMQRLFEQLQVSIDQRDKKSLDRLDSASSRMGRAREHVDPVQAHDLKAAVLERLQGTHTAARAVWRQTLEVDNLSRENKSKATETQTKESPQETCLPAFQHDLEERNRLLHERLASQQKVLDELLDTKLKHANTGTDLAPRDHPCSVASKTVKEISIDVHGDEGIKSTQLMSDIRTGLDQRDGMLVESTATSERRPLSPPAA